MARCLSTRNERIDFETETFIPMEHEPRLEVRRLMPIECERLQGLPDDYTEAQSDSVRYRQLGNAVAVPVVEWIGRRLMAVDTARRAKGVA